MKGGAALPVLMRDAEVISLKEACFRSGRSEKTIARWCRRDGIGRRAEPSAPWEISAVALEAKRYGDTEAIEALRRGEFSCERVRRYAEHLGLG
ncbi:hypothetical protein [Antarcticirhabdus aurantiaca]|uniref:Uncharacterized protein n=1 Tax=Antarcticirhabdus aurantiaca TaxID=2606717 RepID=A0ACD4NV59_9HYPH|nr:hypothetical protein [Antarcticirhabdus aurantiaca]WAJ30611.1 hypothetical protein OXU80_10565 [Jeongeuplla avenae]